MPQGTGLPANDLEGKDKRTMLIGNADRKAIMQRSYLIMLEFRVRLN